MTPSQPTSQRARHYRQIVSITKVMAGEYDVELSDRTLYRVSQDRGLGDRVEGWSAWADTAGRPVATTMSGQTMREVLLQIDGRRAPDEMEAFE